MSLKILLHLPPLLLISCKDHVYRIWKVEGRCTQLTLSSLHTYIIIGWHKSIVSSDWSDTMVWFGPILLYLSFTIYIWSLVVSLFLSITLNHDTVDSCWSNVVLWVWLDADLDYLINDKDLNISIWQLQYVSRKAS